MTATASDFARAFFRVSFIQRTRARATVTAVILAAFAPSLADAQPRSTGFPCNTTGSGIIHTYTVGVADNYATGNVENSSRSGKLNTQITKWTTSGALKSATSVMSDADGGLGITALPGSSNRLIYAATLFIPPAVFSSGRMISAAELEIKLKPRGAPMYTDAGVPGSHNDVVRMVGLFGTSQYPSIAPNSDQSTFLGQDSPPWNVFAQVNGKTVYITVNNPLWITSTREFNFLVYHYSMVDYATLRICTMPP